MFAHATSILSSFPFATHDLFVSSASTNGERPVDCITPIGDRFHCVFVRRLRRLNRSTCYFLTFSILTVEQNDAFNRTAGHGTSAVDTHCDAGDATIRNHHIPFQFQIMFVHASQRWHIYRNQLIAMCSLSFSSEFASAVRYSAMHAKPPDCGRSKLNELMVCVCCCSSSIMIA